ncbi:hypothetical protein GCM10023322_82200 [Rugosimonospora acidiphila]|uniref:SCP2 domain-containing protein n=1 Tax=Rugosimonospora acidiphila TaxID=556531 RepID=A0ABP9SV62_9ACTN
MPNATVEFFEGLGRVGHIGQLGQYSGAVRFDLHDDEGLHRWLVSVDKGDIRVSHDEGPTDCVIDGDRATFDLLARGEVRPLAAFLRNQVTVVGSFRLLLVIERMLPGPPGGHDPRDLVPHAGRRS